MSPGPRDDFGIRGNYVGPLRWNRANLAVVDAQQNSRAGPIIAFTDADELSAAEWVEGMGYADNGAVVLTPTRFTILFDGLTKWARIAPKAATRPNKTA